MDVGRVVTWGAFRIRDQHDGDYTPHGMKERALMAMLALSPGQRRRRLMLQDMLWGKSTLKAGQVSLRQALSNIRRDLGPLRDSLKSDRDAIWLDPPFLIAEDQALPASEFLADLDVPDEEFESWLRDQRQAVTEPENVGQKSPPPRPSAALPVVGIVPVAAQFDDCQFLCHMLAQQLADLVAGIAACKPAILLLPEDGAASYTFVVEVQSGQDEWLILVRLLGDPVRQYLWSNRLRVERNLGRIWDAPEFAGLLNKAVAALNDQLSLRGPEGDIARIQRAIRRIYNYDKSGLETAIGLLRASTNGSAMGLALAWQAFAQLTSVLEFRTDAARRAASAIDLADEAVRLSPQDPTVLALAAQTQLKFTKDFDYSHHLALRAVEAGPENPYALDALSQSQMMRGELSLSQRTAERARLVATGLANSFSWDMQAAFGALCMGRSPEALDLLRQCHLKMPAYRPALRYLIALSALCGNDADAQRYSQRLARLEPCFTPLSLLDAAYPMETLRSLGLDAGLKDRIG
ncbi:hypothetical protein [Paracoccus spongiarum]|uniref:Transcriptional regulator n=1 Tax=Paracoccus spongiarum TaxID=3064387 RepID=A0ABT9JGX4_9RHOB|nr:hypothetical protein [Paracoccus sp. 2205BS29-5]MDP5309026.1 hypothetical protein [Paracoccus sp. 2205BS29-5]